MHRPLGEGGGRVAAQPQVAGPRSLWGEARSLCGAGAHAAHVAARTGVVVPHSLLEAAEHEGRQGAAAGSGPQEEAGAGGQAEAMLLPAKSSDVGRSYTDVVE